MKHQKILKFIQLGTLLLPMAAFAQTYPGVPPIKNYEVNYVSTPPTLDGVADDAAWTQAAPGGGNWGLLRKPVTAEDSENSSFKCVWDQNYLYFLVEADVKTWEGKETAVPVRTWIPGGANVQGGQTNRNNINIYLDPNTDGEIQYTPDPVDPLNVFGVRRPDNKIDGYQIMWNYRIGTVLGDPNGELPGIFTLENKVLTNGGVYLENHINQNGGNQGRWSGLRKSRIYQITTPGLNPQGNSNATPGKVTCEFALAWEDIDSPNRERFTPQNTESPPKTTDIRPDYGTFHPNPPSAGEKWFFDITRITNFSDNNLPIWSWHNANGFNQAPHGTLEFKGGPRSYEAKYTSVAPTLDGVVAPGEWDAAAEAGDWGLLRQAATAEDAENNRFRMMWDKTYLYLLVQSDKTTWQTPGEGGISFGDDNLNLYIDPNLDKESNGRPGGAVDGYQIAWNQREGDGSLLDDGNGGTVRSNTGFFLENHINNGFGNQGRWQGLRKSRLFQKHGGNGGVVEFAIAWEDLDSPAPAQWTNDPATFPTDTGTAHPKHPIQGEEWIVNLSRISSNPSNFLPIWSWQKEQSFTWNPHGIVRFSGGPRLYQAQFTTRPPVIDGIVQVYDANRNYNEWGFASDGGGDWALLRQASTSEDAENSRFKLLWDDQYLYLLFQSDKAVWPGTSANTTAFIPGRDVQGISFGEDNLNIYIDPNNDGEPLFRGANDGYQIAFNQREGLGSHLDDGAGGRVFSNTGLFLECHIDSDFGNQGRWQGLRKSEFVQNYGAAGGVTELKLAWEDLDSPAAAQFPGGLPADVGTAHPYPARNGERFNWEISRISSDGGNFLPVWNWHQNGSFAPDLHGLVEFVGRPTIAATVARDATSISVSFNTAVGNNYDVQWSTPLSGWVKVSSGDIKGTGGVVTYTDTDTARLAEPKGFYRAVLR